MSQVVPPEILNREFRMLLSLLAITLLAADDFDHLEGLALAGVVKSAEATRHVSLTITELGNLPNVLAGVKSPVVVVKTDEGNPARLMVSPALRKPPGGQGEPIPVLIVERFDTFEAGPATRRLARGRDLMLFDGFRLDLDSGQVVPEGQGGDIQFVSAGDGGPRLIAVKGASVFTLAKSPLGTVGKPRRPSPGRAVLKSDFTGRYRLVANGQSSGRLDLDVDPSGAVSGRFRSDQTGASYKVTGQAGSEAPNTLRMAVELPRARQEFVGYLFVEGKGAIAGSFELLGREFGFFAIREGGMLTPDGEELAQGAEAESKTKRVTIVVAADGATIDGKAVDDAAVAATMRDALAADPSAGALVRLAPDVASARVLHVIETLRDAGAPLIRIGPAAK